MAAKEKTRARGENYYYSFCRRYFIDFRDASQHHSVLCELPRTRSESNYFTFARDSGTRLLDQRS